MTLPLGLLLDILLAVLLSATLGYCFVLMRKLERLRGGQSELRKIIAELLVATQTAERAISGLRRTTDEADARLSDKLRKARALTEELSLLHGAAERRPGGDLRAPSLSREAGARLRRTG